MGQKPKRNLPKCESLLTKSAEITRTTVLVLDGSNTLSFAAAVDPMRAANRQAGRRLFDWQFATPGEADVLLTSGLRIPAAPLQRVTECDLLLVVAGFNLEAQATPALCASLRRLAGPGTTLAGIDGGPWILASAGLLDQHDATTHWEDLEKLASNFANVRVRDARFVVSGNRLTSGGAAPAIEMMLHLIGARHGHGLADKVAGSFIYESAAPAALRQSRQSLRTRHSAATARAHAMMEAALEDPLPITRIARAVGLSPRALQMQFRARLETSPQAHYLALRLEEADRRVIQTDAPLHEIAIATGFTSQSAFARAYAKAFGAPARVRRRAMASGQ